MPRITGVLETCIHVQDIARSAHFYESLFGFRRLAFDERFCAFDIAGRDVLILFRLGGSLEPVTLPGGVIPPHGGSGKLHFAFSIPVEDLGAWEQRLAEAGVKLESRVRWPRGGESLYFRDPDDHLVELATPGIWPTY
jgi:catechol 2,3-dioxygenase-like lactoylglutathione lyase family enzyme